MKKLLLLVSFFLTVSIGSSSWAYLYTGAISNRLDANGLSMDPEGGIAAVGNAWAGTGGSKVYKGLRLEWGIDYNESSKTWNYTYSIILGTGNNKTADSFNVETADNFSASDLLDWTVRDGNGTVLTEPAGPGTYAGTESPVQISKTVGSGQVRSLFGFNWSFPIGNRGVVVNFSSTRAPMWGDLLITGESTNTASASGAWNSQFGIDCNSLPGNGNNGGWALVPGSAETAPVPVPPTLVLFGSGLSGLFFLARRKMMDISG